jgi:uncharacterized membrane protein
MEYIGPILIIAILLLILVFIKNRRKLGEVSYGEDSSKAFVIIKNIFGLVLFVAGIFGALLFLKIAYDSLYLLDRDNFIFMLLGFAFAAGFIFIFLEKGWEYMHVRRMKK